jgi:hypothetical protein
MRYTCGRQVRGLYKGAASPITGCAFYSATLFLSYGQVRATYLICH